VSGADRQLELFSVTRDTSPATSLVCHRCGRRWAAWWAMMVSAKGMFGLTYAVCPACHAVVAR